MSYFSANLKYLRGKRDLSQQGLADAIGVKKSNIGSWEEGRATPNLEILMNLANYFSISIQDLLTKYISSDSLNSDSKIFSENAQVDAQVNAQVDSKKTVKNGYVHKPPEISTNTDSQYFCDQCKRKQEIIDAQKDLIDLLKDQISVLKDKLNDTDQPDKNGQKRKAS